MIRIKKLALTTILVLYELKTCWGFSECPGSGIQNPNIPGITDCPSWLAYAQNMGQNLENWCRTTGRIKCCLTCQNILETCVDRAYTPDCEKKFREGACQNQLADQNPVQFYCRKTCGFCSLGAALSCNLLSQTCGQGVCLSTVHFSINTIRCVCPSNFVGAYCERSNPCLSNPCQNNAACSASNNADVPYTCACPPGFSGLNCQNPTQMSGCGSNPCQNNGACQQLPNGGYQCFCQPNFSGTRCELFNACFSNPCRNGGNCINSGNGYICRCPINFGGINCEIGNSCSNNPCLNGGICEISFGQIVCICPLGFSGQFCQTSSGCGTIGFCQNGGRCITQGSSFICICPANVYGRNCEYAVNIQTCLAGDRNTNFCSIWSAFNFCQWRYSFNQVPVPIYCPRSCGLCTIVSSCIDSQANCAFWANLGLCSIVNDRDPNLCKRSCGLCGNLTKKK